MPFRFIEEYWRVGGDEGEGTCYLLFWCVFILFGGPLAALLLLRKQELQVSDFRRVFLLDTDELGHLDFKRIEVWIKVRPEFKRLTFVCIWMVLWSFEILTSLDLRRCQFMIGLLEVGEVLPCQVVEKVLGHMLVVYLVVTKVRVILGVPLGSIRNSINRRLFHIVKWQICLVRLLINLRPVLQTRIHQKTIIERFLGERERAITLLLMLCDHAVNALFWNFVYLRNRLQCFNIIVRGDFDT